MIQLYADDTLVYDSRLKDYALLGLQSKGGLNKGGTATILMPPGHPAYNSFTSYRTVVTIYRDGKLRFRGRALYPTDDFMLRRTISILSANQAGAKSVYYPINQPVPAISTYQ